MGNTGRDLTGGILGAIRIKKTLEALQMTGVKVRVLENGKMFEDTGRIMYRKYAVFNSIERAFIAKDILKGDKGSVFVVDESTLKYDAWELYKIIQATVVKEPELDLKTIGVAFLMGCIIGLFGGALIAMLGVKVLVVLGLLLLAYGKITGGAGHVKT